MICGSSCADGSVQLISVERAIVGENEVGRFRGMLEKPESVL